MFPNLPEVDDNSSLLWIFPAVPCERKFFLQCLSGNSIYLLRIHIVLNKFFKNSKYFDISIKIPEHSNVYILKRKKFFFEASIFQRNCHQKSLIHIKLCLANFHSASGSVEISVWFPNIFFTNCETFRLSVTSF